ncbi:aerobic C4-dicarboxylate transport protein [Pseudomonas citronellolis]|uniref:C4-dicarboxylate transport protein n=1 Tax=Pseudomonas citronellolis TaxID=53408 RepID=A0AAQ1HMW8_9PSED|nr:MULTISPECIES: dicarboxylate/amino acid:cation symporter [Pseudomonas]KRV74577.1 C4-dicarboxylate transporter [Pseudomonas citronellolis]KRW78584.1 C4-dicarboxylate transporter [Pseudomonas citronellolis]MBB1605596.1 C4-dicarboxylate transporter DctA [Pseudomonas sp. UMC76]MBB1639665.1 C4-dicarboxylate transporter DctA [Pseudomonas sp. UME83]MCL6692223.1 dicarboxylate/amino acid:cation symporter [Pseudomonas sp. R3.Fl]
MTKQPFYKSLYVQVLIAIAIGIALGHYYPQTAVLMKPLGDGFVKLIKMAIAPIIFCTVVTGIAGMQSMKAVGKTGGMALLYFEIVSTIALIIGLVVVNVVQPGAGMHVDPASLDTSKIAAYAAAGAKQSTVDFLMNIIPNTVVGAFANGDILQVLFFSVLFGYALHRLGSYGQPIFQFIERFTQVMFNIINVIMKVAPIGAFGAMAFTIGAYGVGSLVQLGQLMACFYITCLLFVLIVLGGIARAHGFNILKFIKYIREELLIVLGTSSSESALPRMIAKMEKLGCDKSVVGLVIPTGYSFNLDGTSIYLTMAAVFIAQATDTPMDITHQLTLLLVLLIASKGAAGVTGSGFIVLAATLSAVGHLPVAGLALILGIDRFMSEARALTNLVGNGVATVVVAKWCKQLDSAQLERELAAGPSALEAKEAQAA